MSNYLAWRCTYQDPEAAARAAYNQYCDAYTGMIMYRRLLLKMNENPEGKTELVKAVASLSAEFKEKNGQDEISYWDVFLETLK